MPARTMAVSPPEIVVHDKEEPCSYLPDRLARQPLRYPLRRLAPAEFDVRLEQGDRRAGTMLYNQACPSCVACEALRVGVTTFVPSRSQRRAQAKGDAAVTVEVGPIEVDDARIALYRSHHSGRDLERDGATPIDAAAYESYLAMSCTEGFEVRYFVAERLAGVAITDCGARALSAVYTFWDPAHAALSLGTYSILTQIALARQMKLDWLYLGLAIRENHSMAYKLAFMPHERRIAGAWRRFARD
ncbi:MAG TPA: arginyltransferase [Polyangia bacterium]|jgi:arginine-tRNA-protein transferase